MDDDGGRDPQPAAPDEAPAARARRLTQAAPHRTVQGSPTWQTAGLLVLVLGLVVYLHGVWAAANGVLAGGARPERVVDLGLFRVVQGTLGLVLGVFGLVLAAVATAIPVRIRPDLEPGTLEYGVAVEGGLWERRLVRGAAVWALALLVSGVALSGFALARTAATGEVYVWTLGTTAYRPHLVGFALVALAFTLLAGVALRAVGRDELVAVVEAHTRDEGEHDDASGRER